MQRKKIVLSITLALGLVQSPTHAQIDPVIQLSDLDGSTGFRLDGAAAGDNSGFAVSTAGDVNGDGFDDLLIGAFGADPNGNDSGSTYVVFGQSSGFSATVDLGALDGTNGFRLDGESAGDLSGRAVSSAGDVNGDGIDDLLIGASGATPNGLAGSSYIVFGKSTPFTSTQNLNTLDGSNGFRLDGPSFGSIGESVSAGDVNGDGFDDLIISGSNSYTYVVFGTDTGFNPTLDVNMLDGTNGFRLQSFSQAVYGFGFAVSSAGDVNGDGIDDLLVPEFTEKILNGDRTIYVSVVFGKSTPFAAAEVPNLNGIEGFKIDLQNALLEEPSFTGPGVAVSNAGDVNGDGIGDILIGQLFGVNNGIPSKSYVLYGQNTPFNPTISVNSIDGTNGIRLDGVFNSYGNGEGSVSNAGDVNGDGFDDILIGDYRTDPNGHDSGSSYLVFGKGTPFPPILPLASLEGSIGFQIHGEVTSDLSGFDVSSAGDVNGDGFDDLIIGAPNAGPNGSDSGSSYVVFGPLALSPLIDFDQKLIDFGDTPVGTNGAINTLTLNNPGIGTLSIDAINLTNPAFAIAGGDCGALPIRIPANESCMLDLQFTPQAAGVVFTNISFSSTSATSPDAVALTGRGIEPPIVSLQADPLIFEDTPLGNSVTETLMVENTGLNVLEPGAISIQGTDAVDFNIAMNNCLNAQLETNQTCDIEVSFTPSAVGTRAAILQLESNAPSSPDFVELIGSSDVIFKSGFE